ncbi:MAG TPA: nucleotide pyrophosphohydrolase [Holosporales bacterium]|nr:nucleotide pyrophosphohydrolase [Holosporales bacterium]
MEVKKTTERQVLKTIMDDYYDLIKTRGWQPYTNAKSVAMNLHVEAGELAEHFTWLLESDLDQLSEAKKSAIGDELGDVMLNVLHLASLYEIDILKATQEKLEKIKQAYPIGDEKLRQVYLRED